VLSIYSPLWPWLVFVVADRNGGIGPQWSGVLAVGLSMVLIVTDVVLRRNHPLLYVGASLFAGQAVLLLMLTDPDGLDRYDRAFVVAALAVALAASSVVRPLTIYSLRDRVPVNWTSKPDFTKANRQLTLAWSGCAGAVAGSLAVGAQQSHAAWTTTFNWLVPMAFAGLAVILTNRLVAMEGIVRAETNVSAVLNWFELGQARPGGRHPNLKAVSPRHGQDALDRD
jgi:hypothetical protein